MTERPQVPPARLALLLAGAFALLLFGVVVVVVVMSDGSPSGSGRAGVREIDLPAAPSDPARAAARTRRSTSPAPASPAPSRPGPRPAPSETRPSAAASPMPKGWEHLPRLGRREVLPGGVERIYAGNVKLIEAAGEGIEVDTVRSNVVTVFASREGTAWLRLGNAGAIEFVIDEDAALDAPRAEAPVSGERAIGDPMDDGERVALTLAVGAQTEVPLLSGRTISIANPDVLQVETGAAPNSLLLFGLAPGRASVQMGPDRYEVTVHPAH